MVFKKLHELTASELRVELRRAGIKGKYVKAEAIMRLTTHLIDVSEDPVTFEFDPEEPIVEADATDGDDYEVINETPEIVTTGPGPSISTARSAVSVSGLINAISAGTSTTTSSVTSTTSAMPFVATASSVAVTTPTPTITIASSTSSYPYTQMGGFTSAGIPPLTPHIQQLQMQNPYHPVLYPGMPGGGFYPRYPTIPPSTAFPGLHPTGPTPPWPGMWTPWGGWAPLSHPLAATTTPVTTAAATSLSGMSSGTVLNPAMAEFTGACPPPARSSETKSTKITSGQYDSGRREVKERQNWPQVMIDHILNPEPLDYDEMDWSSLTAGMTGKILAEMDPAAMDIATVNKLKHLNRLANYGMKTPIKSILNFNAVLFRAVENQTLTWNNWDKIDQFHTRHLSSLTVAAVTSGAGKSASATGSGGSSNKKPNWETLRKSMADHHMCFKFNKAKCDQEDDHDTNGNGKILLHACGMCAFANRGIVKNHGAQECKPDFWPAPFRSQHRTTGGGSVQQN